MNVVDINTARKPEDIHTPWLEPGMDPFIKAYIEANWRKESTLLPAVECQHWARSLFEEFGTDIVLEINTGEYTPGETGEKQDHVWLSIDGKVFDPTASRFDNEPHVNDYNCLESETSVSVFMKHDPVPVFTV